MTTQSTADKKSRRRWFSPRFSLRMLMLLVTAAAVGSAFWWRWPVTQTTDRARGIQVLRETFTYHRGLRGELIKHGVHRETVAGEVILEEYYREGVLHGPYRKSSYGEVITGEYYAGKQHGTWEFLPRPDEVRDRTVTQYEKPFGVYRVEEHWNLGKRDGLFQWWDHTGKLCFSHEFKNDKLMTPQNNPTGNLLLKRIADGTLNDQELEHILLQRCDMEYHELPLKEVIEDCKERFALRLAMRSRRRTVVLTPSPMPLDDPPLPAMHEIPFSDEWTLLEPDNVREAPQLVDMRPRALARPAPPSPLPPVVKNIYEAPVSVSLSNVPLLAGFDAILSPLGLVLDYRYGVLCVVDASDAESWRDLTGVMDLHPPANTDLSGRLDAPAKLTTFTQLAGVLKNLSRDQQIPVEFRMEQIAASASATNPLAEWPGLPADVVRFSGQFVQPKVRRPITLRQLLGLLLDQAHLHCHEENGVLIIEPPSKAAAQAETRRKP